MDLLKLGARFHQLKNELVHGGYQGEFMESHITDIISQEILSELGEIENLAEIEHSEEVKKALVNMFFLGQITNGI